MNDAFSADYSPKSVDQHRERCVFLRIHSTVYYCQCQAHSIDPFEHYCHARYWWYQWNQSTMIVLQSHRRRDQNRVLDVHRWSHSRHLFPIRIRRTEIAKQRSHNHSDVLWLIHFLPHRRINLFQYHLPAEHYHDQTLLYLYQSLIDVHSEKCTSVREREWSIACCRTLLFYSTLRNNRRNCCWCYLSIGLVSRFLSLITIVIDWNLQQRLRLTHASDRFISSPVFPRE